MYQYFAQQQQAAFSPEQAAFNAEQAALMRAYAYGAYAPPSGAFPYYPGAANFPYPHYANIPYAQVTGIIPPGGGLHAYGAMPPRRVNVPMPPQCNAPPQNAIMAGLRPLEYSTNSSSNSSSGNNPNQNLVNHNLTNINNCGPYANFIGHTIQQQQQQQQIPSQQRQELVEGVTARAKYASDSVATRMPLPAPALKNVAQGKKDSESASSLIFSFTAQTSAPCNEIKLRIQSPTPKNQQQQVFEEESEQENEQQEREDQGGEKQEEQEKQTGKRSLHTKTLKRPAPKVASAKSTPPTEASTKNDKKKNKYEVKQQDDGNKSNNYASNNKKNSKRKQDSACEQNDDDDDDDAVHDTVTKKVKTLAEDAQPQQNHKSKIQLNTKNSKNGQSDMLDTQLRYEKDVTEGSDGDDHSEEKTKPRANGKQKSYGLRHNPTKKSAAQDAKRESPAPVVPKSTTRKRISKSQAGALPAPRKKARFRINSRNTIKNIANQIISFIESPSTFQLLQHIGPEKDRKDSVKQWQVVLKHVKKFKKEVKRFDELDKIWTMRGQRAKELSRTVRALAYHYLRYECVSKIMTSRQIQDKAYHLMIRRYIMEQIKLKD